MTSPTPTRAWIIGFTVLLTVAMSLGTYSKYALGALAPFITVDLSISRAQLGSLTSVSFLVGALLSPAAGAAVDHLGGRKMLLALFSVVAIAFLGMGLSPNYFWLIAAVAVAGLGSAGVNPATNQLVATYFARGGQGLVMGIKQSGVQVGGFLAGLILPTLGLLIGWRGAIMFSVVFAAFGLIGTSLLLSARHVAPHRNKPKSDSKEPLGSFIYWLALYAFFMGTGVSAVVTYIVLYSVEVLGFNEPTAGLTAALIGLTGIAARIVWARTSERADDITRPLTVLALVSVTALLLFWASGPLAPWLVWPGAISFGTSAAAWTSVGNLAVVREYDVAVAGRASGVMHVGFYSGLVATPIVFGAVVDRTASYEAAWLGIAAMFIAATVISLSWTRTRRRTVPSQTTN